MLIAEIERFSLCIQDLDKNQSRFPHHFPIHNLIGIELASFIIQVKYFYQPSEAKL